MSSEEEDFDGEERETDNNDIGRNIASSLLFGNIDNDGRLTDADDIFDQECQRHLTSLQAHLSTVVPFKNLIVDDEEEAEKAIDSKQENGNNSQADTDYSQKVEEAVDYSDIADVADDEEEILSQLESLQAELKAIKDEDIEDDDYDAIEVPNAIKTFKPSTSTETESSSKEFEKDKDGFVIPKPITSEAITTSTPGVGTTTTTSSTTTLSTSQPTSPPSALSNESPNDEDETCPTTRTRTESGSSLGDEAKRKLDTPLAAMLPSKYANSDVTELFPEFRHNQVLRFSRLFGPGKSTSRPQIWKHVRNRRKNRHLFENKLFVIQNNLKDDANSGWKFNVTPVEEIPPTMIEEDDEVKLLTNDFAVQSSHTSKVSDNSEVAEWRYGPAQFWYDMLKVPENGEGFDYGFKVKKDSEDDDEDEEDKNQIEREIDKNSSRSKNQIDDDDAFLLVTQANWESDIIWNGEDVKPKVLAKLNDKNLASGWLPSNHNRTASAFTQQMRATSGASTSKPLPMPMQPLSKKDKKTASSANAKDSANDSLANGDSNTWYSIFPIENEELMYSNWEDNVIWDAENMSKIPEPKLLTLDRNDENIILDVPVDIDLHEAERNTPSGKEKKDQIRKSRLLLGKAGVIAEPELITPPSPPSNEKDPYNISNDEYYQQKVAVAALKSAVGSNLIQHSIPALELRQPFFPTHLSYPRLQQFHRQTLKRYSHGMIADTLPHGVNPLVKHIKRKAKAREQERINSGGGEMFFMRTPEDLTGRDGDLIMTEYSEEHPPLIMQVGMASKIKNYYRRRAGKDTGAPVYKYGETVYTHNSPFLGNLTPGQSLQALENNLFRAPIYEHKFPETDFLVIRTRDNYYIRSLDTIYTVGQELPVYEVPGPNSKKANNFIRDFLQVFIFRLFLSSKDVPKRIKMEDIKKAFPSHSESSIRKRLKQCADFKRTGMDSNWWVIKSDFRLPSDDEIRAMVSPEACCAYYSMLAAEQRLKDAGYGEKSMFAPDDAEDEDLQVKMDDEVKAAPWNTTRAFISAMKGKCLLQLTGVADPTGCGEGFSYVRIPNKPTQTKEEQQQKETVPKKTVTGTDADLRRLPLNAAKNLLRKFGVPDEEIKKLSRWEVIDVVRTLSTKQAKQADGETGDDDAMSKFARGNRFSIAEHQERYKEECQRIFELQNQVLASTEDLSTDEDESEEEEDSDLEEMGKNIELMLANKKTIGQMNRDKEEEERRELKKMLLGDDSNPGDSRKRKEGGESAAIGQDESAFRVGGPGRILKIHRTFTDAEGNDVVRIEIVRKSAVIDTYLRIRSTKDDAFIKQFACALDDQQKEERRKERRRIQEQQRRAKRNQEKEKLQNSLRQQIGLGPMSGNGGSTIAAGGLEGFSGNARNPFAKDIKVKKVREKKLKENLKLKCGACGGVGHMRTNRACPLYGNDGPAPPALSNNNTADYSMTDFEDGNTSNSMLSSSGLGMLGDDSTAPVKMDENKLILSKSIIKQLEEQKMLRDAKETAASAANTNLKLKIPKEVALGMKRKKRAPTTENTDYLLKPDYKLANRRRTDPLVTLSDIFEEVLNETKNMRDSGPFAVPVLAKDAPTYHSIIERPMDLQTIRQNIRLKQYKSREEFLRDVGLIVSNSEKYNGANSILTTMAKNVAEKCALKVAEKEDEIIRLEKMINPLLDSDLVAFSYVLKTIVSEKLKTLPDSWPFHKPVNKKAVKNYYEVIEQPIDLETMELKAAEHQYRSREEFMSDLILMHENSAKFNGADNKITAKAAEMIEVAREALLEIEEQLTSFESSIRQIRGDGGLDDEENSNMVFDYEDEFEEDEDMPPSAKRRFEEEEGDDNSNQAIMSSGLMMSDETDGAVAADVNDRGQAISSDVEEEYQEEDAEMDKDADDDYEEQWMQQESTLVPQQSQLAADEDFDADYDPSDFLLNASFGKQQQPSTSAAAENEPVDVTKDLDVSDSDMSDDSDDMDQRPETAADTKEPAEEADDVWF